MMFVLLELGFNDSENLFILYRRFKPLTTRSIKKRSWIDTVGIDFSYDFGFNIVLGIAIFAT